MLLLLSVTFNSQGLLYGGGKKKDQEISHNKLVQEDLKCN